MQIDPALMPAQELYPYLVGLVTPRPIAWVSTISRAGVVNLSPFSFFNIFGANPPVVVFSPTLKRDSQKKDTLRNIEENSEFVINASVASLVEKVNLSSKELPPEESEVELIGVHTAMSVKVKPPRITEAPFALECQMRQIIPVGDGPISANLVIGQVVHLHIDESILGADGKPDPRKLRTVARLGASYWCHTSDLFELPRP